MRKQEKKDENGKCHYPRNIKVDEATFYKIKTYASYHQMSIYKFCQLFFEKNLKKLNIENMLE